MATTVIAALRRAASRRDAHDRLRDQEKKKEISEDELKRATERLQKLTDRYIEEIEKVGHAKETEIMEV